MTTFETLHGLLMAGNYGEVIVWIMNNVMPYGALWFLFGVVILVIAHLTSRNLLVSVVPFSLYFFVVQGYISNVYAKTIAGFVGYILIFVVAYGLYKLIKSE